jgi:Flp pilus assembly protein TadD
VAQQASILLVRYERYAEALTLLERATKLAPDDAGLPLTKAIILGLTDRNTDAENALQQLEARWPEWDRPYLAHALLLEHAKRSAEARRKIQAATALGSRDLAVRCAAARFSGAPEPEPQCGCVKGLRELLFPACPLSPPAARGAGARR